VQNRSVYILETTLSDVLGNVLAAGTSSRHFLVAGFTAKCVWHCMARYDVLQGLEKSGVDTSRHAGL
jgi:hypothetical protein